MHTGRMPCEREGRDWGDVFTCLELTKLPGTQRQIGERHGTDSS